MKETVIEKTTIKERTQTMRSVEKVTKLPPTKVQFGLDGDAMKDLEMCRKYFGTKSPTEAIRSALRTVAREKVEEKQHAS